MSEPRSILLLGGTGQIGHELHRELADVGVVTAPTRATLDVSRLDDVRDAVRALRPDVVVNAAAYTLVDRAESERDECTLLNAELPTALAGECKRLGALLVHFSTDYVFDGAKRSPYLETDDPSPLGVYGRAKLDGERGVAAEGEAWIVFRTSWIYAARGRNFPLTMLRLAREREELAVVNDQVGAPTSAPAVAAGVTGVLRALGAERDMQSAAVAASGVYHMTARGATTWYELARRVLADDPRRAEQTCRMIRPITTAEYPTPAPRPAYSVLDNGKLFARFGVRLPDWEQQWRAVAAQLSEEARTASAR